MNTATASTTNVTASATRRSSGRVRLTSVMRSEWIKLWSVRSTAYTLVAAGIVTVAFGMIFSAVAGSNTPAPGPGGAALTHPIDLALAGINLTEMIVGVLGVIVVAGEYSTGMIRTSLAAAGRRYRVVAAKAGVLATSVAAMAIVGVVAAILAGQAVYAGPEPTVPLSEVLDVATGAVMYLTGIGLIGVALGFILRSTSAGIATLVGGVFIGPNLLRLLPESITEVFFRYLPSEAGSAIMARVENPDALSTGSAYVVFAAWVVGLLATAVVLVARRDA